MIKSEKKEQDNAVSQDKNDTKKSGSDENKTEKLKEETVEEKLESTQEKLLRAMAEIENQRRRFEKEKQEAFDFGGFNFAKESLSLLDNILDGIEIIKKDLISIFKKNDIDSIDCINKKFDPNFHQAMLEIEDSTKEPGTVVQEIQKGYMMKDRLLRPSLVGVTKKREEKVKKTEEKEEKK